LSLLFIVHQEIPSVTIKLFQRQISIFKLLFIKSLEISILAYFRKILIKENIKIKMIKALNLHLTSNMNVKTDFLNIYFLMIKYLIYITFSILN
jgi:hypothetical protein